jgi:hypothetical protein
LELFKCSPKVMAEHSAFKRRCRRLNLHNGATARQRPELLAGRPTNRATDSDDDDGSETAEQPPPVPTEFQPGGRHGSGHVPPPRRETTLTAADHLERTVNAALRETKISPPAAQALDRRPEQPVDKQAHEEVHAMKY